MASTMQTASRLYTALQRGGSTFGAWQTLSGHNVSRLLAHSGVDWICVDCENGNIADDQMHEAVTTIASCSVSPIVRIPATESWMVKRALDTGAHAIMVPLLRTPAEARQLASATKFPPRGTRGFGSPFTHYSFHGVKSGTDYYDQANNSLLTIVQIETKEALDSVEEIAAVEGIDVLFVGPFDLGNNIGRPIRGEMHDDLKAAIERIRKAAASSGKKSGIFCTTGAQAKEYAAKGFNMISITGDMYALTNYISEQLNNAKGQ